MPREPHALERPGSTANLADVLERVLDKGIVIAGDIKLFLGEVELLTLQIRLVVCSIDKAKEMGLDWWTNHPSFSPYRRAEQSLPEAPAPIAQPTEPHR
jgi:hypothetical protein